MSQALRKLAGTLNRTDTICLFTNQLREKIGVMFGNPETTPGGRALKFYSSVRLDIRRIETLKEGVEAIGNRVRVKVVKNKVAPPFKQAEFDIIYGDGISWEGTVLDAGLERKIVQKSGSYFSFGDERLGQGRQNATAFLREHPDVAEAILRRSRRSSAPSRSSRRGCCRRGSPSRTAEGSGRSRVVAKAEPQCGAASPRCGRPAAGAWRSSSTERLADASGRGGRRAPAWRRASSSTGAALRVRRELRRAEALDVGSCGACARATFSRARSRAARRRGVAPAASGARRVDGSSAPGSSTTTRFARARAAALADRGWGDARDPRTA